MKKRVLKTENIKHKSMKKNLATLYIILLQSSFVISVPHVVVYNSF